MRYVDGLVQHQAWTGLYQNADRHKKHGLHCLPNHEQLIHEEKEAIKENRISNIMQYDTGHQLIPYH
jgi:hypothetical protein